MSLIECEEWQKELEDPQKYQKGLRLAAQIREAFYRRGKIGNFKKVFIIELNTKENSNQGVQSLQSACL